MSHGPVLVWTNPIRTCAHDALTLTLPCGLAQAAMGGAVIVRVSIESRNGTKLSPGWRGPASSDDAPVDVVVCVEVIDNGSGFGQTDPEVLFQPFYLSTGMSE